MEIKDLTYYEKDTFGFYGGNAGQKYGILIDGEKWIVKFPESTRSFPGRDKLNVHLPSYTLSPESEYIGSHIYELLGIPVHQTMLGFRDDKIVVACKDFTTPTSKLIEFKAIKNTINEDNFVSHIESNHSGGGGCINDVLYTIENAPLLKGSQIVKERFWDMFVVDAFIKNNDRNNGNWGILQSIDGSYKLAPVYDNGNCLFNKRNDSVAERRIENENLIKEDVVGTNVSFYKDIEGHSLKPMKMIQGMEIPDLNDAVIRLTKKINITDIQYLINDIPESAFGKTVISINQKQLYCKALTFAYENVLLPTYYKLIDNPTPSLPTNITNNETKNKFNILPPNQSIAEARKEIKSHNKLHQSSPSISHKRHHI